MIQSCTNYDLNYRRRTLKFRYWFLFQEDNVYEDSFRNMISVWCSLFGDYGIQSKVDILREYAIRIFSKYVQSRIAPPNGFRSNGTSDEEIDNENLEDLDRVKYLEQLQVVGIFGRYILDYSLPVLYK